MSDILDDLFCYKPDLEKIQRQNIISKQREIENKLLYNKIPFSKREIKQWIKKDSTIKKEELYTVRKILFGEDERGISGHLNNCDSLSAEYIEEIIYNYLNLYTRVIFKSYQGTICYIIVEFPDFKYSLPNIVVEFQTFGDSSNDVYLKVLTAIFYVLNHKNQTDYFMNMFYKKWGFSERYDFYIAKTTSNNYGYHYTKYREILNELYIDYKDNNIIDLQEEDYM